MKQRDIEKYIKHHSVYPEKSFEDICGYKLNWYQKIELKIRIFIEIYGPIS